MADIDLADYDQVDEAKFFMSQKLDLNYQNPNGSKLLVTLSSSEEPSSSEEANCENDFVFLPAPQAATANSNSNKNSTFHNNKNNKQQVANSRQHIELEGNNLIETKSASDTVRYQNKPLATLASLTPPPKPTLQLGVADALAREALPPGPLSSASQTQRVSHPLMALNSNSGSGQNPFYNLQQHSPESASSQAYRPFWMRPENFKPIGLLEIDTSSVCSEKQTSDLMHQLVTRSDSIYIAIPCACCHELKACPPSDISAWLNHMNQAHNCRVCPICNKLVGLGPMRDLEIMQKHVVSHIDDAWLESRCVKTEFSFGLQKHWYPEGRCSVKDPRTVGSIFKI